MKIKLILSLCFLGLTFGCHNAVKYSEIPTDNDSLGASDGSGFRDPSSVEDDSSAIAPSSGQVSGDSGEAPPSDSGETPPGDSGEAPPGDSGETPPGDSGETPPSVPPAPENPYEPAPDIGLLPIDGEWASVAYEDNIADASAGDRDFNDAVFNYKISEQYNTANQLVRIFLEVRLREKISASDHKLHLILNGKASDFFDNIDHVSGMTFAGEANAKISYADGTVSNITDAKNKDLIVFKGTSNAKGTVTKIEIELKNPELNVNPATKKYVNFLMYRFILQNKSQSRTGIDIAEINPSNEMLSNANGYPFGFMIPTDWQPPAERQLIDDKYPSFYKYREWLNSPIYPVPTDVLNWYL